MRIAVVRQYSVWKVVFASLLRNTRLQRALNHITGKIVASLELLSLEEDSRLVQPDGRQPLKIAAIQLHDSLPFWIR